MLFLCSRPILGPSLGSSRWNGTGRFPRTQPALFQYFGVAPISRIGHRRRDGDKKRHSLLPPSFRTLSLACSPPFMDSTVVLGALDAVNSVLGESKGLRPPW